jgi:hypothetical protein
MFGFFQISSTKRVVSLLAGVSAALTLSGCGELGVVAASIQFTLSAPSVMAARSGSKEPTPLLVTVTHIIPTPITVPIALTLESPPQGVHAEDVTVGIGQSSATLNVFVDSSYTGPATSVLTVKGTALSVNIQKATVTLQITQ